MRRVPAPFTYDLRFPGQLAGAWSRTFQNDHRDYDPAVGKYVEPDPIGLAGGSYSTFAYVRANPVSNSDPQGLLSPRQDWGCLPGQSWGDPGASRSLVGEYTARGISIRGQVLHLVHHSTHLGL